MSKNRLSRYHDDSIWCGTMSHKWKEAPQALEAALENTGDFSSRSRFIDPNIFVGDLYIGEMFWLEHQPYILSRGYQLRPRYRPEWIPSWKDCKLPIRTLNAFEDSIVATSADKVLDATRISDGYKVVMKRVDAHGAEQHLARYLSSPNWADDPRNHTVPILDIIPLPQADTTTETEALLVMPQLLHFNLLDFKRVGEVVEAMEQFLQGLDFMHAHKIAHRDACYLNLMMDSSKVVPRGVHPINTLTHDGITYGLESRDRSSVHPVQYYFIDFGLSRYYPNEAWETEVGLCGQDRTVPELLAKEPYDPFKLDIYQLGNAFMELVINYVGLESLLPVVQVMTSVDPKDRPSPSRALEMLASFDSDIRSRHITWPSWEPWKNLATGLPQEKSSR